MHIHHVFTEILILTGTARKHGFKGIVNDLITRFSGQPTHCLNHCFPTGLTMHVDFFFFFLSLKIRLQILEDEFVRGRGISFGIMQ